jgi:CelD/BcsL family acetyltransferase involved in cellulose biosynthesis
MVAAVWLRSVLRFPRLRVQGECQVQISVVRPNELGANEIALWRSMQDKTKSLMSPFLCPEFAIAVDKFRPDARVAVLMEGTEIVGFFPFQRQRFGVGVPIGAGLNDWQGLIHSPGIEWDPLELLRACKISVWQFDHLLQGQHPFDRYVVAVAPSPVIDLTDGFMEYHARLKTKSRKFCRNLYRQTGRLEHDVGKLRLVVDSRDLAGLRTLMTWKSDQCRRNSWIDLFDRSWVIDLLDYLFSTHNDWFGGLLSLLYAGDTIIAANFGLRSSHMLSLWFAAYDTGFSSRSPGIIQFVRTAEEVAALGVHLINLGKGNDRYKQALKSDDLFVAEGMVARGVLLGTAHRARSSAVRWAGPQIRKYPHLFRATDRLIRHYGRI